MLTAQYSALEYTNTNERLFYSRKCQAAQCSTRLMNILYGVAMLKDPDPIKPYSCAFLVTERQITTIHNWLHERFGPYGDRWAIKSVSPGYSIRMAAVISFAKESQQTFFQLAWSDTVKRFYDTAEECFNDQ